MLTWFCRRVSLAVMNDPIARSTNTGTRVCELDCQNDDEERVRITVWREHADLLADKIKKGDVSGINALIFNGDRLAGTVHCAQRQESVQLAVRVRRSSLFAELQQRQ